MKFIIESIAFFISWLLRKKAFTLAKLPIKMAVAGFVGMALTLFISAFILFANFLFTITNNLYELIDRANNAGVGSGEAYGVSLSSIWYAFIGFLSASGIGEALYISINLFLSLLFTYYGVKIALLVGYVFKETAKLLSHTAIMIES